MTYGERICIKTLTKALIDELAGTVVIKGSYKRWARAVYRNTGIEFGTTKGDVTGRILYDSEDKNHNFRTDEREYAKYWTLNLSRHINKVTGELVIQLQIKGNPSKAYFGGKNYGNLPLDKFNEILIHFAEAFCFNLMDIKLAGSTEASITGELNPNEFVFNEMSLRGRIFSGEKDKYGMDRYVETKNSSKDFMGYEFEHGHMTNKIYLPGVKFREPLNSVRVEVRFDKIQSLLERSGYHIESWADLLKPETHYKLYQILLASWNDTIVSDPSLRQSKNNYPEWLNDMIYKGKKADFWINTFPETVTDKTRKKRMMEYRKLSFEKGEGLHTKVRLIIEKEGELLRIPSAWLTGRKSDIEDTKLDIEDRNKNNKMEKVKVMDVNQNLIQLCTQKGKKQQAKEAERLRELQRAKFMKALEVTLLKLAA